MIKVRRGSISGRQRGSFDALTPKSKFLAADLHTEADVMNAIRALQGSITMIIIAICLRVATKANEMVSMRAIASTVGWEV